MGYQNDPQTFAQLFGDVELAETSTSGMGADRVPRAWGVFGFFSQWSLIIGRNDINCIPFEKSRRDESVSLFSCLKSLIGFREKG
jgi:hypothetical protein